MPDGDPGCTAVSPLPVSRQGEGKYDRNAQLPAGLSAGIWQHGEINIPPSAVALSALIRSVTICLFITYPLAPLSNAAVTKSVSSFTVKKTIFIAEPRFLISIAASIPLITGIEISTIPMFGLNRD